MIFVLAELCGFAAIGSGLLWYDGAEPRPLGDWATASFMDSYVVPHDGLIAAVALAAVCVLLAFGLGSRLAGRFDRHAKRQLAAVATRAASGGQDIQAQADRLKAAAAVVHGAMTMNEEWVAYAYPLQQITIRLQGTRHSDRAAIVRQLERVVARLQADEAMGEEGDDDIGYVFEVNGASAGPSFFDAPASTR
jgi:hypothetical protein